VAKRFPEIGDTHKAFILRQHIFFVASAAPGTHVNVSPRSMDSFRLLGPKAVAYLDRTGSGNETAAHLRNGGRMTIMLTAFDGPPMIMRLFGAGTPHRRDSAEFKHLLAAHFGDTAPLGTRQIVTLDIDVVQTSCGFGVPLFDYRAERPTLDRWAENKGEAGLIAYQRENNRVSLDGLPTGLFDREDASA
jgi:hypothetical protein